MTKFKIRSFQYFPAVKFGFLIGLIVSALPAFVFSITFARSVNWLRTWLESWGILNLGLLGEINLLNILNLSGLLARLQQLDDLGLFLSLGLTLGLIIFSALWIMVVALLATLLYNVVALLSGGLAFTAKRIPLVGRTW